jgi:hypothetical protein
VDEDDLARHAPTYKERSLPADVRLKAVIHLVVRDIEARVRLRAHGAVQAIARGE